SSGSPRCRGSCRCARARRSEFFPAKAESPGTRDYVPASLIHLLNLLPPDRSRTTPDPTANNQQACRASYRHPKQISYVSGRGLEAREVRPALMGVDVVHERINVLVVAVVVLEGELDVDAVALSVDIYDFLMEYLLLVVEELHHLLQAALGVEDFRLLHSLAL